MHWLGRTEAQGPHPAEAGASPASTSRRILHRLESRRAESAPSVLELSEYPDLAAARAASAQDDPEGLWRLTWELVSDSGHVETQPVRIRMIALSPAPDASEAEERDWNSFYTNTHAREAMEHRHWSRATRWRLADAQAYPADPSSPVPRYVVVYEAPTFRDATPEEVAAAGPWTEGPAVWKRNVTSWSVDYRVD